MSGKVEINLVAGAMKETGVTPEQIRAVMEALRAELAANEKEEKPPACKKQFVILISDPDNLLPKTDFAGWVLQIEETESVATTQERIYRAAYDFNATKKGRLYPAWTVGEAIENVPSRLLKEAGVWAKTKSPVLMLKCDNQIPKADPTAKLNMEASA